VGAVTIDLDDDALDALIHRVEQAREHQLALSPEDLGQLLSALVMLAHVHERLEHRDLTIGKLKKLLGMAKSSEKLRDLAAALGAGQSTGDAEADEGGDDGAGAGDPGAKPGPGGKKPDSRRSSRRTRIKPRAPAPEVHHHPIQGLAKGDSCPDCGCGRVYKHTPSEFTRVRGNARYTAERHVCERLRCNACQSVQTACLPAEVLDDGAAGQAYGFSARALMGIAKYFGGDPFFRQHTMQELLGVSLAASTIFDQCEHLSTALNPVYRALQRHAAGAALFHIDDTTHRILSAQPVLKQRGGRETLRRGVYASAMLALVPEPVADEGNEAHESGDAAITRRLVLYQTNIGHAGEWLDEVLAHRPIAMARPMVMSDALSSNRSEHEVVRASCNAHGRRGFVEVASAYPDEALHALELYQLIWVNDRYCHEQGLSPPERLRYHQAHSDPPMQALHAWCTDQLDSKTVEANSSLGRVMQYLLNHFEALTLFLREPGAPIDNNEAERLIKLIVRGRKNSFQYRTETGAGVSDVITSILATCHESAVNAFDYLVALQRHSEAVRRAPEQWLPWSYETAMANEVGKPTPA